jgi:hypothetical protein
MFKVAEVRPYGVTLTNGFLPNTSPDDTPIYSETELTQVLQGNWYKDGFPNNGKDVKYDVANGPRDPLAWTEWNSSSADLAKTSMTSGYSSWDLMTAGLRPLKNQMFPTRIFDDKTGETILPPGRVRVVR